jgi:pyruvate-formate lyase-activating enzyme
MKPKYPQLLVSDKKGKVFELTRFQATAMKAGNIFRLAKADLIKLPIGSSLFLLPKRLAVGFSQASGCFETIKEKIFAVAAFLPPGYALTFNCAFKQADREKVLPLFAYAPVVFYKNNLFTTAIRIDKELRQDERCMDIGKLKRNIRIVRAKFAKNRLFKHLEGCAQISNCPAAKNLFLNRYEAPLPTSPFCNSRCLGCISFQPEKLCPITQPRIKFIPTPAEIAEVAVYHISKTKDPVVSFGQGCEGEPLLVGKVIEQAIKLIRKQTQKGIINLNTNASKPEVLARLCDVGLDSLRVSLNSCQEDFYHKYYKPQDYNFKDVLRSMKIARKKDIFISINYLSIPGFTDSKQEFGALNLFLQNFNVDMIQWRNLNFDPLYYFFILKLTIKPSDMLGMHYIIKSLKNKFPRLMMGYFNPSRARIHRFKSK